MPLAKIGHVDLVARHDQTFHLDRYRHGLTFQLGEMLIDGQVIMHAPERPTSLEDITFVDWLLN